MDRRYLGILMGLAAVHASAQSPTAVAQSNSGSGAPSSTPPSAQAPSAPVLAGTSASDLINLADAGLSVPLRHGGVVQGSESITLNGQQLVKDTDYSMDYGGGVVYLMKITRPGDSLLVNYRYSKNAPTTSTLTNGINGLKLDLLPGNLNMTLGFGLAERGANGQVSRANVFGWNNNFTMKGGSAGVFQGGGLTGLLMVDDHQGVTAQSGFEADSTLSGAAANSQKVQQKQARLVLQNFASGFLGGKLSANFQEVSKDFAAFGAASGVDQETVARLQKEAGLQRQSFGLSDVSVLGLKLTNNYKTVTDPTSVGAAPGITWRDLGVKQGAFSLGWNEQKVDKNFTRFGDLAEANQADLKRAIGLDRQTVTMGFGFGKTPAAGTLGYSGLTIQDPNGGHIYKRDATYTSSKFNLDFGDQQVQKEFLSFGNLAAPETPVYQFDSGLRRQWFSLKSDFGKGYTPLNFSQSWIKADTGQFLAQDATFGGKDWTVTHSDRAADKGFNSFGSINAADTDAHVNAIGAMYGPTLPSGQPLKVNAPAERGLFAGLSGLEHRYDAASFQPNKELKVGFSQLNIQGSAGPADAGVVNVASIANKKYNLNYRTEDLGANFSQLPSLMSFERQSLGTIIGLKRTDLGFSADLGKGQSISYSLLDANAGTGTGLGSAQRQIFDLKEKTYEISFNHRQVDSTFTRVNELVDPENTLLSSLVGYDQTDLKFNGTGLKNNGLKFSGQVYSDINASLKQDTSKNNLLLNYDTPLTSFAFTHIDQHSNDPLQVLLGQVSDSFSLAQKFGTSLKFHVAGSSAVYDGTQAAAASGLTMVDATSHTVGLEYKLNASTNLASEMTNTNYSNGEKSSIRNDSVSESISKRAGLTLSESIIDNPTGQLNTQTKRNYGFWYDLGKGLVFNYGYVRQLDTTGFSTLNSIVSLGQAPASSVKPDQLGALPVSSLDGLSFAGGYAANQWQTPTTAATGATMESTRTQAFSNLRIATAKPMKFGQISNFNFNFSEDSAADNFNWIRQTQDIGFSGKYGATGFGFAYKSQTSTVGDVAVDRTFNFTTDASAKKFISAAVLYKVRTLPDSVKSLVNDQNVMIRNYDITIRPTDKIQILTQLMTNPEVTNGNAMLGSITQGSHVDRWKLIYASTAQTDLGATWEENINESNKAVGRTAGLNLTLFKATSPIKLFYGYEDVYGNVPHRTTERWSLQFDQRPGANQSFNFFVGNISYGYALQNGQSAHNLTARVDYVLKF